MLKGTKILHDKRAITPVLSNLLITVIAVAAMAIATTSTYVITANLRENMGERIIIEDLWFNTSPKEIRIYVRNIGKVAVHISAIYINHTTRFRPAFSLEVGTHAWLNITYSWVSGGLYYIDIVTSRGTHDGGYYMAT